MLGQHEHDAPWDINMFFRGFSFFALVIQVRWDPFDAEEAGWRYVDLRPENFSARSSTKSAKAPHQLHPPWGRRIKLVHAIVEHNLSAIETKNLVLNVDTK